MIALLEDALAAYRITRLVTADHLTEKLRNQIVVDSFVKAGLDVVNEETAGAKVAAAERLGVLFVPKAARLVTCPWCSGFWISCAVVAARRLVPRAWEPVARVFALSAAAGILSEHYSE